MRLQFILSEMMIGLRRNLSMTVSVILVTFVSLVFVGAAALLQMQINNLRADWFGKVEVSVFLCPPGSLVVNCADGEATDQQVTAIRDVLESPELDPIVERVYFETKDDVFESFQRRYGDEPMYADITVDDMQQIFRVKLTDPEQYEVVAEVLSGRPGVEEVKDQRDYFQSIFQLLGGLTALSIGLAVVMLVAAVLLVATTIRLSAMSRRRETGIMRLVGASNLFIQLPFMLEGAIAATIGALLACVALWFGVQTITTDWLAGSQDGLLGSVDFVTTSDVLTIAPALVGIAIVLATISSVVTLSRYTRV